VSGFARCSAKRQHQLACGNSLQAQDRNPVVIKAEIRAE
jgi:hypothetical protein